MTHSARAILTDVYDAWRAQNLDLLVSYLPDDFFHSINIPTEMHPLGGLRRGKDAALERLGLIFQQFDTGHLETSHMALHATAANVEVRTRCQHRESGLWLHTTKTNLWTLEDGWPMRLLERYDLGHFQEFMKSAQDELSPGS